MNIEINKRIRELRKLNNLTQTQLAEKLKTTQDTISLWELGKSYPDIESIILLCQLFDTSADYLLGLKEI
ncbi:MAG: helix-turn-helix transcriptional regulator [Clostridia bacterium]|nr:helix-turn-helix transcriptional regulator [Clostridia bacterium]